MSPAIGGVPVRGEKGTARSTAVRAVAALLPEQDVVTGCRFGCDPQAPDGRAAGDTGRDGRAPHRRSHIPSVCSRHPIRTPLGYE
ncbi:hypothetical protein N566_10940 [Streptomycetaceae bacterium MP113-05]|nr:hypothetical protein N566_10940 [Streptomycetaceae bacterium MP113-05]